MRQLYAKHRTKDYNCANFVIDAAQKLYDLDLTEHLQTFKGSSPKFKYYLRKKFKPCKNLPESGIVLFINRPEELHIGLIWKGKILHLAEKGVQYLEIELISWKFLKTKFYEIL